MIGKNKKYLTNFFKLKNFNRLKFSCKKLRNFFWLINKSQNENAKK